MLAREWYSRRKCLDICDIPDSNSQNDLENKVYDIFHEWNVCDHTTDLKSHSLWQGEKRFLKCYGEGRT